MSESDREWHPPKESGYFTDFEDFILSEMVTNRKNLLDENFDFNNNFKSTLSNVNLEEEANRFIDRPTSSNIFYPNIDSFMNTFCKDHSIADYKAKIRISLEYQMDQENRMEVFGNLVTEPGRYCNRSQSVDLFETSSEDEIQCISSDICNNSAEDEKMCNSRNALKPIMTRSRQDLIADIDKFIINLLEDIVSDGNAKIMMVNCAKWNNCELSNGILTLKDPRYLVYRNVNLKHLNCRYHFAMIMYVLSAIYQLLITDTTCTERELYYDDPDFTENQLNVKSAIRDVCNVLNTSPWELGIRSSSKGLIAGAIRIHMSNNIILDCYMYDGATLIPGDMQAITFLETTAKFVLIIEKDTIFEKLLKQNILINLNSDIVLITGKGFPDLSTRLIVKRLWDDFHLPIYALVDADPFGIEILFVYRFGSRSMVLNSDYLACPQIRWIGIQPSEIDMLAIPSVPQSKEDTKKVIELLHRTYLSTEIRNELEILQRLARKAEIEGVASFSANFLVSDYIPNKIKRNLFI